MQTKEQMNKDELGSVSGEKPEGLMSYNMEVYFDQNHTDLRVRFDPRNLPAEKCTKCELKHKNKIKLPENCKDCNLLVEEFAEITNQGGIGTSTAVSHSLGALIFEQVYKLTRGQILLNQDSIVEACRVCEVNQTRISPHSFNKQTIENVIDQKGQIYSIDLKVTRVTKKQEIADILPQFNKQESDTELIVGFWTGEISHCMYLRGFHPVYDQIIGHNSFGLNGTEFQMPLLMWDLKGIQEAFHVQVIKWKTNGNRGSTWNRPKKFSWLGARIYSNKLCGGPFDIENYKEGEQYLEQAMDGKFYRGEMSAQGQRQGFGTYYWSESGSYYQGFWANSRPKQGDNFVGCGDMSGRGRRVYGNGDIFEGNFFADKKDGFGTMYFAKSGNRYIGEFVNDTQHDNRAKYIFKDGTVRHQVWIEGKAGSFLKD